jgi:putative secretion ATPase (PEP-CTERM system associated)
MYEAHFGLSGPPFQLVPDPGFFFGSRGHSNALAFLKAAAQQGDGFLVVTGEIGAGKTTLVRTLLEGLDKTRVVAATMVSTQLESGDLPQAILLAYGAPGNARSRAKPNAKLEAFLIGLAEKDRRALLIVDEAQNLGHALIEELRMLSNLQAGAKPLLQVFLVGQPDLRTLLQAKAMEQLRQRVTASCHLGPLDANETRAYVEHRLHRVGWNSNPRFEENSFSALHQWTAGIPRRINRLCNRMLLAAFLERHETITAQAVEQIARDLRSEIGESDDPVPMQPSFVPEPAAPQASPQAPPQATLKTAAVESGKGESEEGTTPAMPAQSLPAPASVEPITTERAAVADAAEAAPMEAAEPAVDSVVQASAPVDANTAPPASVPIKIILTVSSEAPLVEEDEEEEPLDKRVAAPIANALAKSAIPSPTALPAKPALPNLRGVVASHETRPAARDGMHGKPAAQVPPRSGESVAGKPPEAPSREVSVPPARPPQRAQAEALAMPGPELRGAIPPTARAPLLEPLVLLVDSAGEYVKARALSRTLSEEGSLPPTLIVHTGSLSSLNVGEELAGVMPQTSQDVHLDINEHGGAASAALAITRFDAMLRAYRPRALMAMGVSDTLLTCSLFAHKNGVPVLRSDAGRRRAWSRPGEQMNAALLERLADSCYIGDMATFYTLYREGIPTERVLLVGNLADNVIHCADRHTVNSREILKRAGIALDPLFGPRGYALCTAQFEVVRAAHDEAVELIAMLTQIAVELPVVWAVSPATLREIEALGKLNALRQARIELAASLPYLDCVDLLRGSRCVLAGDAGRFLDDAVALRIPGIVLGRGIVVPVKGIEALQLSAPLPASKLAAVLTDVLADHTAPVEAAPFWDGGPAARIALHLTEWLPKQANPGKRATQPTAPVQAVPRTAAHGDAVAAIEGVNAG